jgi:hypothetical protein
LGGAFEARFETFDELVGNGGVDEEAGGSDTGLPAVEEEEVGVSETMLELVLI